MTDQPETPAGTAPAGDGVTPAGDPDRPADEGAATSRSTPHAGQAAEPPRPPEDAAEHAAPPADGESAAGEPSDGEPSDGASGGESAQAAAEPAEEAEPAAEEEPDWKDRYLRAVAELDNVRKRARRDVAAGEQRGVSRLARELLPALDNLDRALAHLAEAAEGGSGPAADEQTVEGLRIVHRELHGALAQAGIEAFDPTGQEFDPRYHEALTQQPAPEGTLPGTVLVVYQQGYRLRDDVLRPAKVVVAG